MISHTNRTRNIHPNSLSELSNQSFISPIFPLSRPTAPPLSDHIGDLASIESSNVLSNFGPVNAALEQDMSESLFGGLGSCLTVCNATVGLMVALKDAAWRRRDGARHVIMPALTFAAAAQAALWIGLTPVLVDIDPHDWSAAADAEEDAIRRLHGRVAAVMPYATFGRGIDLARYDAIAERHGVAVVIDAASSIGTRDARGLNFGAGSRHAVVFSLHATKAFGIGEGGLIHSGDLDLVERCRRMTNFGMDSNRSAVGPGINAKMCEVSALAARLKLPGHEARSDRRAEIAEVYRAGLPDWRPQGGVDSRRAYQFMPMLVPSEVAPLRDEVQKSLLSRGVGTGRYFSPHLGQQPHIIEACAPGPLPIADGVASRILSMPIHDDMSLADARMVCAITRNVVDDICGRCES